MEYCAHIWTGASKASLSILDRLQYGFNGLVDEELFSSLQPLSHRSNVASLSLFYRYYYGDCSAELHELVPKHRDFSRVTRFAKQAGEHPHYLRLPKIKSKFYLDSFFPITALQC